MAVNLLGLLKDQMSDDVVHKVAGFLGENQTNTRSALASAVPSILTGLIQKSSSSQGAVSLFSSLLQGNNADDTFGSLTGLLGGGQATNNLTSSGNNILSTIFGNNVGNIADLIASASGIKKSSSMSLLSLAAPIVMGFLSKHVKQQGVTDAAGFASMLAGQAGFLKGALPTGVTNLLGISNIDALAGKAVSMTSNGGSSVLKKVLPFLPIVAILLLGWWLLKNSGADAAKQTVETVKEAAHEGVVATASAVNALGAFFSMRLPSGVDLNIPEYGIENKLIGFIQDANRPVDKTTWFTFDRLLFETGKATMKPESREQLNNIAEILKAFPAVALKIGGYTDNTGNAAANMQLSQARAESVMNELVALGIDAQRLRAEGYGQEHPVADNGTEDGRAKNRRIDVRVTKK